jgi:outer membrane cobalamin receptor
LLVASFLLPPVCVPAATDGSFLLPEVLVTAPAPLLSSHASLTTTLFNRERLDRYRPRTLAEALQDCPGVDTASFGPVGGAQLVSLRGSTPEQVLVLLDGRRLNPAQGGGSDLSLVPLERLERVEVVRGVAPSRFGSEGLGGVVNLVTEGGADGGRLEAAAGAGSGRISGLWRGRWREDGPWCLRLSGSQGANAPTFRYRDPERSAVRERANVDSILRTGGAGVTRNLGSPGSGLELSLDLDRTLSRRGAPGLAEFPTPRARLEESIGTASFRASWRGTPDAPRPLSLRVLVLRRHLGYRDPDASPLPADDSHAFDRGEADLGTERAFGDHAVVHATLGVSSDRLRSTTDGERTDGSFFGALEPRWLLGRFAGVPPTGDLAARLVLEAGVRHERSRLFGSRNGPRAGWAWTLHRGSRLVLRASAGRAVRPPSFDDLFFSATAFAHGNPDLRPERTVQADLGLRWSPRPLALGLTAFRHDSRDLIQWSPDFAGRWRPLNVSRAVVTGLEGEGSLALAPSPAWDLSADGSFTWSRAVDKSGDRNLDGRTLPRRPPFKASSGLRVRWNGLLGFHLRSRFVSYRWLDAPNVSFLPGHLLLQAGLALSPSRDLEFAFTVHNLTDVDARDLNEYPVPGRQWELRTSLGF